VALSLALLIVPTVPDWPAAVAALFFALGAAARALQAHHSLVQLRSNLDPLLLRNEPTRLSPMLTWRAGELSSPAAREHLAADLRRIERAADASHLAGAVPLNRSAVRENREEIAAIIGRLTDADPVSARGMILARRLLDDPSGPLYDRDCAGELADRLRSVHMALNDPGR